VCALAVGSRVALVGQGGRGGRWPRAEGAVSVAAPAGCGGCGRLAGMGVQRDRGHGACMPYRCGPAIRVRKPSRNDLGAPKAPEKYSLAGGFGAGRGGTWTGARERGWMQQGRPASRARVQIVRRWGCRPQGPGRWAWRRLLYVWSP